MHGIRMSDGQAGLEHGARRGNDFCRDSLGAAAHPQPAAARLPAASTPGSDGRSTAIPTVASSPPRSWPTGSHKRSGHPPFRSSTSSRSMRSSERGRLRRAKSASGGRPPRFAGIGGRNLRSERREARLSVSGRLLPPWVTWACPRFRATWSSARPTCRRQRWRSCLPVRRSSSLARVTVAAALLGGAAVVAGWSAYTRVIHRANPAPAVAAATASAHPSAVAASDSAPAPAAPLPEMPKWMATIEEGQGLLASGDPDAALRKFKDAVDAVHLTDRRLERAGGTRARRPSVVDRRGAGDRAQRGPRVARRGGRRLSDPPADVWQSSAALFFDECQERLVPRRLRLLFAIAGLDGRHSALQPAER